MTETSLELPRYAALLDAYHRAHAAELEQIVNDLPLSPGHKVLDMACGDATYLSWLARRVAPGGCVVGADLLTEYLRVARQRVAESPDQNRIWLVEGAIQRLPFADGAFDLVWCAQSLVSLPDPVEALAEMRRVVRPGGVVAVLEDDSVHHILLPWPASLELAVRKAEMEAFRAEMERPSKNYIGRRLQDQLAQAGLTPVHRQTYSADRRAPLGQLERDFLVRYLKDLGRRTRPLLSAADRERFDRLCDPSSDEFLIDRPDFEMTCLEVVAWGRKE